MDWISVNDRMPEKRYGFSNSADVNIAMVIHGVYVTTTGSYSFLRKQWDDYIYKKANDSYLSKVTHWMPLPEPPKTK